ncbi:mandelate racemase/muconate lactonizing enzyme family protein [Nocardia mangyaensis]|uniref:mandelate racemase/muconate lactonizing enzyme family protein n=1 Tax=Nocardia mangyaensis TaxID=2213200 RepID=UPI002675DC2B|nr:enolase C-terminal domain-like protein [Nocardia mangyaensis]MDO3649916.1 enolase C-terminal domain-like protein [Nocardia mangyaensis]
MKLSWQSARLELASPLRISRAAMSGRDAVWVSLSADGHTGSGEVVSSERFGLDTTIIEATLTDLAAHTAKYSEPEQLRSHLALLRLDFARALPVVAALDSAVHDLLARRAGVTVGAYLALPQWDSVRTAYTLGIMPVERAAEAARRLDADGFGVLKIKAGAPDPDEDIARVRAIRAAAPTADLLLDPNGAWTADTAIRVLRELADIGLGAVEQPVPAGNPAELGAVARAVPMPIIADEDAGTIADLRLLPPDIAGINIKLAECGGLDAARAMITWATHHRKSVLLGCQASSSLGIAPALQLAGAARWIDLDGHLLLAHDPWTGLGGTDGILHRPSAPGLGVNPTPDGSHATTARDPEALE